MSSFYRIAFLMGIAHFPILHLFIPNLGFLKEGGILLASITVSTLTFLLFESVKWITKKPNNSALLSGISILAFLIYGHLYYGLMDGFSIPYESFKHRYFLPLYLAVFGIPCYLLLTKKEVSKRLITISAIIFCYLCLQYFPSWISFERNQPDIASIEKIEGKKLNSPDIFYIVLDSYSNSNNLQEFYGFDNQDFLNELSNKGFKVLDKAKSNYPYTYFSLSSSLNMRYINDIEDSLKLPKYNDDYPFSLIHQNNAVNYLRDRGYQYVLSQSAYPQLNNENSADVFISNETTINQFHQSLLSLSLLSAFNIGKVYHNKVYETSRQSFENWEDILQIKNSKFVFFHSLAPHPPLVFNADGSYNENNLVGNNRYQFKKQYINQLKHVNNRVLHTVGDIIKATKGNAIIIIQGDHGTCSSTDFEDEMKWPIRPDNILLRERYGILNAVYVPENMTIDFAGDHTPVNTFRKIFNVTFKDSLPILDNHYYFGRYRPPYGFKEVVVE